MEKYEHTTSTTQLLSWVSEPKSTWYYKEKTGKRGRKPSTHTQHRDGSLVENDRIVDRIKAILSEEFVFYGYELVTEDLRVDWGFIINKKKVYRLMDEAHLLLARSIVTTGKRNFVQFRKIKASRPLEYLVMDIKYVYLHGEKRNVYLLSVMDVCTRMVLGHILKSSMRQHDVILLLDGILQQYKCEGISLRNDNGSQFIAHSVRGYLKDQQIYQEFTHIATPEENGHIEAFHSNLERDVIKRYWFDSFAYAKWKITDYMSHYNNRRRHRSLKKLSPANYWTIMFPDFPLRQQGAESGEIVKGVDSLKNQTPSTLALPLTISERRLPLLEAENQVSDCQNQNENLV
jgi:transposase InsO family protein